MKNNPSFLLSMRVGLLACGLLLATCAKDIISPTEAACTMDYSINAAHPRAVAIQSLMDEYVKKGVPGISVLVSDANGTWAASSGMADIENAIKLQPCHINKLGSITKMMLGVVTWQLIEEGKLSLDDKITQYLPASVTGRVANGKDATVGQLMNHTSGIYDIAGDLQLNLAVINDPNRSWTEEEILGFVYGKPAYFPAGTKDSTRYSNTNTLLQALIVEKVTGQQHKDVMQARIFTPLGMAGTFYYDQTYPLPRTVTQGYLDLYNNGKSIQNISNLNPGSGNGYTGVYSTVGDLHTFMQALMQSKTLLKPATLDYIGSHFVVNRKKDWGAGYGIHHDYIGRTDTLLHAYGHGGADIGYSAGCHYYHHQDAVLTFTINYGRNLPSATGDLVTEFIDKLAEVAVK